MLDKLEFEKKGLWGNLDSINGNRRVPLRRFKPSRNKCQN